MDLLPLNILKNNGLFGTIDMLKKYDIIPPDAEPSLRYKDYDWSLYIGNHKEL